MEIVKKLQYTKNKQKENETNKNLPKTIGKW